MCVATCKHRNLLAQIWAPYHQHTCYPNDIRIARMLVIRCSNLGKIPGFWVKIPGFGNFPWVSGGKWMRFYPKSQKLKLSLRLSIHQNRPKIDQKMILFWIKLTYCDGFVLKKGSFFWGPIFVSRWKSDLRKIPLFLSTVSRTYVLP